MVRPDGVGSRGVAWMRRHLRPGGASPRRAEAQDEALPPAPVAVPAALGESHRQLLMAEQIAGIGYWRLSVPDHALEWSAEVYRIYGLDQAEGLPSLETAIAAYHPEDRQLVASTVAKTIADAGAYSSQWRLLRPDGEVRHVLARGMTELDGQGRVIALLGVFLDVTQERRAAEAAAAAQAALQVVTQRAREAAEASNDSLQRLARHLERALGRAEQGSQAKSRFLTGMSHELRTPLNGILGYAQLLQMEGGLNATQLGRVGSMLEAGQHLLDMINRVLDLSEVEAGRMELQKATIDLRATAMLCLDFVRPAAAARGLCLELDCAPGLPQTMVGDPTRLRQVLLNLLGNAVKFTAAGSVTLHLAPASGGSRLRAEVADTGPGIPAARRHLLFRDFGRLEDADAAPTEGAGLGLAISAQIATAMGGAIGHTDNPGGGSIFWLDVPLGEAAVPALCAPEPSGSQAALRVLVVDDVEMNRTIAAGFLAAAGHTAICADGGPAAIAAVGAAPFDLVFMDIRMPGMDGLEATRRIRELPAGRQVPIVALTAQAFAEQIEACRAAGMDGHLSKPFTPQTMAAAIEEGIAAARRKAGPAVAAAAAAAADLVVFDPDSLARIAAFMPQSAIAQHLDTLAAKGASMLDRLAGPLRVSAALADEAHALAGSAGLFGFLRLADAARRFEHAVRDGVGDPAAASVALACGIEESLHAIGDLLPMAA